MRHIIIAQAGDLNDLVALEKRCFERDGFSRDQFRYLLGSPSAIVAIAKINNNIVGSSVYLTRKGSKRVRMYSLAVDPDYRGQGIAEALSLYCEKLAIEAGCCEVTLEVNSTNVRAIAFYEKHQYLSFGRYASYYVGGEDAIRMKKIIK